MRRTGQGISVEVPVGWSAAVVRRAAPADDGSGLDGFDARAPQGAAPDPADLLTERTLPVLHVSTRPLPATVGDFGSGAVEAMGPEDVFVATQMRCGTTWMRSAASPATS